MSVNVDYLNACLAEVTDRVRAKQDATDTVVFYLQKGAEWTDLDRQHLAKALEVSGEQVVCSACFLDRAYDRPAAIDHGGCPQCETIQNGANA